MILIIGHMQAIESIMSPGQVPIDESLRHMFQPGLVPILGIQIFFQSLDTGQDGTIYS